MSQCLYSVKRFVDNDEVTVPGSSIQTHQNGALSVLDEKGAIVAVFAPGSWESCHEFTTEVNDAFRAGQPATASAPCPDQEDAVASARRSALPEAREALRRLLKERVTCLLEVGPGAFLKEHGAIHVGPAIVAVAVDRALETLMRRG